MCCLLGVCVLWARTAQNGMKNDTGPAKMWYPISLLCLNYLYCINTCLSVCMRAVHQGIFGAFSNQ